MLYFPSVFVSSSADPKDEMRTYRWAVRDAILQSQMNPIMFEYYRKQYAEGTPSALSQEMIDNSDIFVGFYSGQYGTHVVDNRDWAEFEYDYAMSQQKPMILFLPKDNHSWTFSADEQFLAFKQKIRESTFHQTFSDEQDLKAQLSNLLSSSKYRGQFASRVVSRPVFGEAKPQTKYRADVFMIMSFKNASVNQTYEGHIRLVVQSLGLSIQRGDTHHTDSAILDDIWAATYYARVVIADLTDSNPNVFYELGIAHTLGKKTILIAQSDPDEIPFDVKHRRIIFYSPDNLTALEKALRDALQ